MSKKSLTSLVDALKKNYYNKGSDIDYGNPTAAGIASDVSHCYICRKAGYINITGYIRTVPTSETASTVNVASVPNDFMPKKENVITTCINESVSPNVIHVVRLGTDGILQIRNVAKTTAASQVFRLNITYPSDL